MAGLHKGVSSSTKAKVCFDAVFEWAYKAKAITPNQYRRWRSLKGVPHTICSGWWKKSSAALVADKESARKIATGNLVLFFEGGAFQHIVVSLGNGKVAGVNNIHIGRKSGVDKFNLADDLTWTEDNEQVQGIFPNRKYDVYHTPSSKLGKNLDNAKINEEAYKALLKRRDTRLV